MGSAKNRSHLGVLEVKLEAGAELTLVELQQFTPDVEHHPRTSTLEATRACTGCMELGRQPEQEFYRGFLEGSRSGNKNARAVLCQRAAGF